MMTLPLNLCLFLALGLPLALSQACMSSIGEQGSDLGVKFFQQLAESHPRMNLLVSPYGVASMLGTLLLGAEGNTRQQILTALHYQDSTPNIKAELAELRKSLAMSNQGAIMDIATGLFAQKGSGMKDSFQSQIKSIFQCESRELDFTNSVKAARDINIWIRDHTNEKISNLVSPSTFRGSLSRLVVVNSMYFQGLWISPFPLDTKMGIFTVDDSREVKVPMMSQTSRLKTGTAISPTGIEYTVVELPYREQMFSMLIALPPKGKSLSDLIRHMDLAAVQSWSKILRPIKIHLSLPRFSVETKHDMISPFLALGVTDIFDRKKNSFSHISPKPLHVSKILQRARMEVNEGGIKASVATGLSGSTRSDKVPSVIVDRPFLFFIRHNPTGTLLFMGQIIDPSDWGPMPTYP